MHNTKHDFGTFVAERRRSLGHTQKELAAILHVTESAVSKWERGLSYPDITVVPLLAQELGVTSDELMQASENPAARAVKRDATVYRRWRSALLWSTGLAYAVTLVTTFIVNLSVQHTLSWFWVVVAAVGLAASLTTLPLFRFPHRGWIVVGAAVFFLLALLAVVAALYGSGPWLPISMTAVVLGLLLVFVPIVLHYAPMPQSLRRHRTVLTIAVDSVAIVLFVWATLAIVGRADLWPSPAALIVLVSLVPVWAVAIVIRYVPGPGLYRTAIVSGLVAILTLTLPPTINQLLGAPQEPFTADLSRWDAASIDSNVRLLVALTLGLLAVALTIAGAVTQRRRALAAEPALRSR